MKKIFAVLLWELIEKIKTKSFIIGLITTPIMIIGFPLAGTLLSTEDEGYTKAIGIVDTSGIFFNQMKLKADEFKLADGQPAYVFINLAEDDKDLSIIKRNADNALFKNTIEGCLVFEKNGDELEVQYRCASTPAVTDVKRFEQYVNTIQTEIELARRGVEYQVIKKITKKVSFTEIVLDEKGGERKSEFLATFFSSVIFVLLLMTMVLQSGGMLTRSLVEEKTNRLIDVLVSSCTPNQLLTGKVLGLSALGLLQFFLWISIGIMLTGSLLPPEVFQNILLITIYFILGFIFYTALFVGVGSVVSTEQESQQVTGYISMILVFPVILTLPAIQNPDSLLLKVTSYIPLTLPGVMMLRSNLSPIPISELIITIAIMIVSIYLTIAVSAKLFRIGILSYGKMPRMKELFQWIKDSD